MSSWQENFTQALTAAGVRIDAADLQRVGPGDTDAMIEWLRNWWAQLNHAYGAHELLNLTDQVPAKILALGWLDGYQATVLLRHAPDSWTIGHFIDVLHQSWEHTKTTWGSVDNMTVAHEVGEAVR